MPGPLKLRRVFDFDDTNGEIRLFGHRYAVVDLESFCRHLDLIVGKKVAAAIVGGHARQAGRDDVAKIRESQPDATVGEIIAALVVGDILSGWGVTKLKRTENQAIPVELDVRNPIVKGAEGTGVLFVLSYWVGALSSLFNQVLEVSNVAYDASLDVLKCRFAVIGLN
jgi:hypothetical protein